tara:strand:- start:140 stop:445 length:306 start_codon:yes stop_codon:yes gene_type:complete
MGIVNDNISREEPPAAGASRSGKQPTLLTDKKVETLLSTPEVWYLIGETDTWISGVKRNIESMKQRNIAHLLNKGKFEIKQRKKENGNIGIYCRYMPFKPF